MPLTLAYKFVAFSVMMAELNYSAGKLHLDEKIPITIGDLHTKIVYDPQGPLAFAGLVETESYSYSFSEAGRLQFITKLDSEGRQSYGIPRAVDESITECMGRLSQMKSVISSNDAYRIATNWLVLMSVDLNKLEIEKAPSVRQQLRDSAKGVIPIPLFYVMWGGDANTIVDAQISGLNGELLNLRQERDWYSKRPAPLIKNMDMLLAIPDEEFLKYSDSERSNLVVRFAAVQYPLPNTSAATTNKVPDVVQHPVSTATQDHNEPAKSQ